MPRPKTLESLGIEIRETPVGRGVFAAKRFRKGQIIGEITGEVIDDADYGSNYCMRLGDTRSLEPEEPFRLVNHSCDPNCEIFYYDHGPKELPDRLHLQALRTIQPGEELSIDYAWPADAAIQCLCGSPKCRGWIVEPAEMDQLRVRLKREEAARKRKATMEKKRLKHAKAQ